ncbi:MAG: FAD-dependent oxidoreductase [Pseudomonadota bacterium]|nr:FAD-dependent oxidoreductase [Pseudomonadota bacterium]
MAKKRSVTKKRIVILGGGFGGVYAARQLRRQADPGVEIELINETNYFVFQPLLPEVAGGIIAAADAVTPLRVLLPGVKIRQADIHSVDFSTRTVHVVQGSKKWLIPVQYDELVIAVGQVVNLSRLPGMAEHAFTMKNLADAYRLRNHIIDCLEQADTTDDPAVKERLLNFVVVGAGFSGVETVGEMEDLVRRSLKYYPNIRKDEVRFIVIEFGPRILPELPEELASYAQQKMERRGIRFLLKTATKGATFRSVETSDGQIFGTKTVVATIGNGPSPLVLNMGIPLERGKIKTDRYMRVPGQRHVWALGDAALIPLKEEGGGQATFAPPTAQFAVREAQHLAHNIYAAWNQRPLAPLIYKPKGALASLGAYRGVGLVFGVKISGIIGWLVWRAFYITMLPGFMTKVRVCLNWMLDYLLPRNTVQVQQGKEPSTHYARYRKGDVVFAPGMFSDGFYTVLEGKFELVIEDPETGEKTVKCFGPGEHFGERVIFGEGLRTGKTTAVEDSYVLRVNARDFKQFASAFKVLDDYFKEYIPKAFPRRKPEAPAEAAAASEAQTQQPR